MSLVPFFVGTYTIKMGHIPDPRGEGVTAHTLNLETGEMCLIGTAPNTLTGENPTYMCSGFSKGVLYTVSEVQKGEVRGLRYNLADDLSTCTFELINAAPADGADTCHIVTHKAGESKVLYCANYSGGNAASFTVKDDDSIEQLEVITTEEPGCGHNPARQEASHPHQCVAYKNKFIFVPNLGIDRIQVYKVEESGKLSPELPKSSVCSPGDGPRHLALHPTLDVAYFIQELSSKIIVCKINEINDGVQFTKLQEISTLPVGYTEESTTAAIRVDKAGKFLYGTNRYEAFTSTIDLHRGHNSVVAFKVNPEDGTLELVGHVPTQEIPRDFALDPTGKLLVVANQNSHSLFSYRIDSTGMPVKLKETYCGSPVAVHFL